MSGSGLCCPGVTAPAPGGEQGRQILQLWDVCHAFDGEHAALQLPLLVLLQQHRAHQPDDRRVVGVDIDQAGAAL